MAGLLRSWRAKTEYGYVVIEETADPDRVGIVIEREGDTRRTWLTEGQFDALCDLRYTVKFTHEEKKEPEA